jgi:hypothetical protein
MVVQYYNDNTQKAETRESEVWGQQGDRARTLLKKFLKISNMNAEWDIL